MRVLLVNDSSSPGGGAEILTLRIAELLRGRGLEAKVFSCDLDTGGGPPRGDFLCRGNDGLGYNLTTLHNPWAASALTRAIREFQPDLVHVRMFLTQLSPSILNVLRGTPSLYHAVWYRAICPTGLKMLPDGTQCTVRRGKVCLDNGCLGLWDWGWRTLQLNRLERNKDVFRLFLANSGFVGNELRLNGFDPVRVLWNAVPVRPERQALSTDPSILYVGRITAGKGVDVLLRAFHKVLSGGVTATLHFAGSGNRESDMKSLAAELRLGDRVQFHGYLPQTQIQERFGGVWAQVAPSVWPEPFGLVAAKGMMRGLPVIAAKSGGLAEFIEHGETGLHVRPGSVEDLAGALSLALTEPETCERLGRQARSFALLNLSEETFIDKLLGIYADVRSQRNLADG